MSKFILADIKVLQWKENGHDAQKKKDANLIRRVGPDKGGHWEVV